MSLGAVGGLLAFALLASCASSSTLTASAVSPRAPVGAVGSEAPSAATASPAALAPKSVQPLQQVEARVRAGEFSNIHAVLVTRSRETLAEFYLEGEDQQRGEPRAIVKFGPEVLHDVRSITKGVVSLLFGIAQGAGHIKNVDQSVLSYFPEYADLATPARKRIRLRHLLSMTSGLQWSDESIPYDDPRNRAAAMNRAQDPIRYVLSQPIASPPGTHYQYSAGDVTVLAGVLVRATGVALEDYARRHLFEPLGIAEYEWARNERGEVLPDTGLRLRPRDMAKLGTLVLRRGRWHGRQVVPEAWIEEATSAHVDTTGAGECGVQYGYYFFVGTRCQGHSRLRWVAAVGNGGQRVVVIPSEQLVIALTAGLYDDPAAYREVGFRLTNTLLDAALQ